MLDLQELQVLAQLVDNLDVLSDGLEKSYNDNDNEAFNKYKSEILKNQKKISDLVDRGLQ